MHTPTTRLLPLVAIVLLAGGLQPTPTAAQEATEQSPATTRLLGSIVDSDTQKPIAARVYLQDPTGNWLFVGSANEQGTAWPYAEQWVPMPQSVERHTTVSADPFYIDLPPGEYQIQLERGKEYLPLRDKLTIPAASEKQSSSQVLEKKFSLQRWNNIADSGWYSGETHVHRRLQELPNVMRAEELNVAFPVTFWTTNSNKAPDLEPSDLRSQGPSPFGSRQDRGHEPIWLNDKQVILPRNTEYEIFSLGQRRHTLGAMFILNHRTPFAQTAPPITPIVQQARREGALLDLDKHNWPWSLMLVPVAEIDLFELANNSVWRTNFGFQQAGQMLPPWRQFEQESPGVLTEWGWLQFGFEMYYALLNCGFRISPSAGTASGVHPVPLGHSRVYVHTGADFNLEAWLTGLKSGRSFVTTGPMLDARINNQLPGQIFQFSGDNQNELSWSATIVNPEPISRVELIVNGEVQFAITPQPAQTTAGAHHWSGQGSFAIDRSGWAALRTWAVQPDGRKRFAHTGSWYFEVAQEPVRPPQPQIDYLLEQLDQSLEKQRGVLAPQALAEFEQARDAYRQIQTSALEQGNTQQPPNPQSRPTRSASEERYWLENMAVWHRYSLIEISQVLGKSPEQIRQLLRNYELDAITPQAPRPPDRLTVMPYPGGRHPRRGFLDGAIDPQRETKFSLFTPWDDNSYIVGDVPEAIFSNLGLIYLAHTHIPTRWDEQDLTLNKQEWQRPENGLLKSQRVLPNGIRFDVTIAAQQNHVRMELALFNGTPATLSGLRVQQCLMLANAAEFHSNTNDNKIFHNDYGLVGNSTGTRWLITSWKPLDRTWGNPPVPCLHADPSLPDCPAGATTRAQGWLSFYEGQDWQTELERIEATRWWEKIVASK